MQPIPTQREKGHPAHAGCPSVCQKNHRFEQFHRIPSSAEDGTKFNFVISGDMRLGNDPSHAGQGDFCPSNRALARMHPFCRKRPQAFYDKLRGTPLMQGAPGCPLSRYPPARRWLAVGQAVPSLGLLPQRASVSNRRWLPLDSGYETGN